MLYNIERNWRMRLHVANVVAVIITGLILYFDPIGVVSFGDRKSADIIYRFYAEQYRSSTIKDIAVILVDDEAAERLGGWPLSLGAHAMILEKMQFSPPLCLFIDYVFIDERDDVYIGKFLNSLRSLSRGGTSIFLAADYVGRVRKDVASLVNEEVIKLVSPSITRGGSKYPQYVWGLTNSGLQTAATAMGDCAHAKGNSYFRGQNNKVTFDIIWQGNGTYSLSNIYGALGESQGPKISDVFNTFSYVDALESKFEISAKYVFIGQDITYARDRYETPIFSRKLNDANNNSYIEKTIPGVFLHAMAFDNIVYLKDRVVRSGFGGKLGGAR